MGFTLVARTVHCRPLGDVVVMSEVLTGYSIGSSDCALKIMSMRKSFPCPELIGWSSVPALRMGGDKNRGLDLMLQGVICLLHSGDAEDALQPLVYLTHPIGGGC
jgi:hypothetical protein